MRRLPLVVLALFAIAYLAACSGPGSSGQVPAPQVSLGSKVRIGVDASLPAFEEVDSTSNQLIGLDIDLMKAIAAKENFGVEFVNVAYDRLIQFVSRCQLDGGISAISPTDDLRQQINFSDTYFTTTQVVVVKKGNIVITGRDKLAGMTVGTEAASPSEAELARTPGAIAQSYPSFFFAFQDLVTANIDAVIADKPRAVSYANTKPNNLKVVGAGFGSTRYSIATCRARQDLTKKVADGLATLKADGTLDRLTQKWITNR